MSKPKKRIQGQAGASEGVLPRPETAVQRRALALVPDPLLSLTTTAPTRPTIAIDGAAYRISFYEDFALWQHLRLQQFSARAGEFDRLALDDEGQEVTPEQWAELEVAELDVYGEIVRIALPDLPEPTLLALTLPQRRAIATAFFAATAPATPTPEPETTEPTGPTAETAG